jgi:hypothetical protein
MEIAPTRSRSASGRCGAATVTRGAVTPVIQRPSATAYPRLLAACRAYHSQKRTLELRRPGFWFVQWHLGSRSSSCSPTTCLIPNRTERRFGTEARRPHAMTAYCMGTEAPSEGHQSGAVPNFVAPSASASQPKGASVILLTLRLRLNFRMSLCLTLRRLLTLFHCTRRVSGGCDGAGNSSLALRCNPDHCSSRLDQDVDCLVSTKGRTTC